MSLVSSMGTSAGRASRRSDDRVDVLSIFVREMPVAVAMVDREMRYLQASDRWCAYYQLELTQLIGRS
jgi:hypothetical protein